MGLVPFDGSIAAEAPTSVMLSEAELQQAALITERKRLTKHLLLRALLQEVRTFKTEIFTVTRDGSALVDMVPATNGVLTYIKEVMEREYHMSMSPTASIREIVHAAFGYDSVRAIAFVALILEGRSGSSEYISSEELRIRIQRLP